MATPRSNIRSRGAFTLIEMLIALAVLTVVFLLTSSGIVQALRTHQVQESTTSAQSKMRRVTEVLTQELRGAVLGGISDFPEVSDSDTVSFTLLTGTAGHIVTSSSGWGSDTATTLYEPNPSSLDALVGSPAIIVNGNGEAVVVSNISSVNTSSPSVSHPGCAMAIDHTRDTQLFGVRALSFDYDPDADTLFLREVANGTESTVPFAFGITRFDVDYEYERTFDRQVLETNRRDTPHDVDGWPAAEYESGGETFELNRLRVTVGTETDDGVAERTFTGFVEMAGVGEFVGPSGEGNSFTSLTLCDTTGGGDPGDGGGGDPGDGGDDGGDGGDGGDDGGDGGDGDEPDPKWGR
jgi:prepilin-type N-terminal cleavage/methylation domain-containing protein